MPETNHRILTVREAAEFLGLAKSTLDKLRLTDDGPIFIQLTKRKRVGYLTSDLLAYVASRRRRSTSDEGDT